MIVEVVGGAKPAPVVRVADVDDLERLHLAVGALTTEEADEALRDSGLGRLVDPDTAFLDIAGLRAVAEPRAKTAQWSAGWEAMVERAHSKGWTGDEGTSLRAHVETAAGG